MGGAASVRLPIERGEDPGEESFFAFRGGAITSLTTPEPGIKQIPHGIAEHVETVNENRQAKTRPESQRLFIPYSRIQIRIDQVNH